MGFLVFCAGLSAGEPEAKRLEKASWSADKKFYGADAFVPDWRKAEEIDKIAASRFMEKYWSKYRDIHDAGNQGPNGGIGPWSHVVEQTSGAGGGPPKPVSEQPKGAV
jgi:hypothetical protein